MPGTPLDPVIAEADQRVERAKASLRSRVGLLERRFVDVRDRLDVPEHIRRHPWPAIGIAFALGALAGRGGRRFVLAAAGEPSRGRPALALIGKLAFRVLRELALAQVGLAARRWLDQRGGMDDGSFDDTGPFYAPGVERNPAP
ncbi:MAG: hypothetical protein E6J90_02595 [Deltaproteobacteria bacterium]|nr:MAG: hypothetical protein E6J91_29175 [Deltaproteobacteria bacterium]TMQ27412.1 MAG: hypothetical protein E6J90_02595 [Deltaproteobacteria bacterium]